jgi:hypothetical protein
MSLRSTQPLTEISTRNRLGGKGRPARKTICESNVWKMWEPRRLTTLLASVARYSDRYAFRRGKWLP